MPLLNSQTPLAATTLYRVNILEGELYIPQHTNILKLAQKTQFLSGKLGLIIDIFVTNRSIWYGPCLVIITTYII
jgi:hypothetical protein